MNSFINNEIEDLINGVMVGEKSAHLKHKIKNQDFSKEMIGVNTLYNKIINNTEYLKCILILSLKKVTWNRELREKFDCSKYIVETFKQYMKYNGFIVTKQLTDIDDILYEVIIKTNPKDFYSQTTKVNLITLTPDGEEFCKRLLEDCIKLQRGDILFTINEINNKTIAFRKIYNNILKLENKLNYNINGIRIQDGYRYIKYPDGTLVMKKTYAKMQLDREKKMFFTSNNTELIVSDQNKSLSLLNSNELMILDRMIDKDEKSVYNGLYSHLNSIELDKVIDGITKEEERQFEKEYKEELKYKNKILDSLNDKEYYNKILNKREETDDERIKRERECLIFLNKLEVKE